jgi:hypothetical protein
VTAARSAEPTSERQRCGWSLRLGSPLNARKPRPEVVHPALSPRHPRREPTKDQTQATARHCRSRRIRRAPWLGKAPETFPGISWRDRAYSGSTGAPATDRFVHLRSRSTTGLPTGATTLCPGPIGNAVPGGGSRSSPPWRRTADQAGPRGRYRCSPAPGVRQGPRRTFATEDEQREVAAPRSGFGSDRGSAARYLERRGSTGKARIDKSAPRTSAIPARTAVLASEMPFSIPHRCAGLIPTAFATATWVKAASSRRRRKSRPIDSLTVRVRPRRRRSSSRALIRAPSHRGGLSIRPQ